MGQYAVTPALSFFQKKNMFVIFHELMEREKYALDGFFSLREMMDGGRNES